MLDAAEQGEREDDEEEEEEEEMASFDVLLRSHSQGSAVSRHVLLEISEHGLSIKDPCMVERRPNSTGRAHVFDQPACALSCAQTAQ